MSSTTFSGFTETGSGTINLTSIKAVCYGRGKYLKDGLFVVGGGATFPNSIIYTSVDGITSWTGRSCTVLGSVNGLAWKNNKFIAVGYNMNGVIAYSFSGTIWYSANYGSVISESYGVSEDNRMTTTVVDGSVVLDNFGLSSTQQLDVTSEVYQEGYTNLSLSLKSDLNIRY